jgi:uncharacterized RDD family membrane protein YckC
MSGLTTTGLTNHATGGDFVVQEQLSAGLIEPSVEPILEIDTLNTDTRAPEALAQEAVVDPNAESWRAEVAARLERYRTRRKPRIPRYPSLLLPFDSPESWSRPASVSGAGAATAALRVEQDIESAIEEEPEAGRVTHLVEPHPVVPQSQAQSSYLSPEPSAKVIEFPRSAAIPVFHPSDLADPVFDHDRPRIVEAPEILPPPPALGGMLIEPLHHESGERPADSVFASPSATIARRAMAALLDSVVVAASLVTFAALVFRLNPSLNPARGMFPLLAGAVGIVAVLLWAAYKFLFVVYTGSTPGLRVARLQLERFDGSTLNRRTRRWRVLTSFLSAFSAGLGYLWCVLDQDGLCWHDRITRTHVTPAQEKG